MHTKLNEARARRANGESGFTLIELLVVVVIIGILVAIAIPLYLNYRKGAENKAVQSDVRGAISSVESYYSDNGNVYPATTASGSDGTALSFAAQTNGTAGTANVSGSDQLAYKNNSSTYVICGISSDTSKIYVYNSANGGSVQPSTSASLATCATSGV